MAKSIYLDYAAATPMDSRVLAAMQPYFNQQFHNPSATYLAGQAVSRALEQARGSVASWLGVRPAEIIFTSGATEANNLAVQGVMRRFPNHELLVSAIEHESVLAPAELFKHQKIPVSREGLVDPLGVKNRITDRTVLISLQFVNNELGSVQPIRQVGAVVRAVRSKRQKSGSKVPLYLHTDAAQAANYFDLHVHRLGADLMSINGGKIYGPKQTGVLFIGRNVKLQPLILGGGQERGLRSGTENLAGAIGLTTALDMAQKQRSKEAQRVKQLRDLFISALKENIPIARINGSLKQQAPHILSVTLPGHDNERLMMELDETGVIVAVGSACSASAQVSSHVLKAIGRSDKLARSTLRFSFGRGTTAKDILKTTQLLERLVRR